MDLHLACFIFGSNSYKKRCIITKKTLWIYFILCSIIRILILCNINVVWFYVHLSCGACWMELSWRSVPGTLRTPWTLSTVDGWPTCTSPLMTQYSSLLADTSRYTLDGLNCCLQANNSGFMRHHWIKSKLHVGFRAWCKFRFSIEKNWFVIV